MGKNVDNQLLPVSQQSNGASASRTFLCRSMSGFVTLRCVLVFVFSLAAFLSAVFWIVPLGYGHAWFDAKESVKHSASVQAHFKLQKPVSKLVPYIPMLEYQINDEIGVPSAKIAVLSMHPAKLSNWTDVVFGFLPDPINSTINSVSLFVLKSSLVDLFLQGSNLSFSSNFGEPSSFEILKFPGGITLIPERSVPLQLPPIIFNFTLNSTINHIKDNLPDLKKQLKLELRLVHNEVLHIQVTNKHGSTKDFPVTVDASIVSDLGMLPPERLRQLAQIITGPTENLGLNHSVFGKVKEISLSSFLNHSLNTPAPTATPSPAPAPSPNFHHSLPPCSNCYTSAPSVAPGDPHCGSTDPQSPSPASHLGQIPPTAAPRASIESPLASSPSQISPSLSPSRGVEYGSRGPEEGIGRDRVSPPHVSPFTSSGSSCSWRIQRFHLTGLAAFLLLFLIS